MFFWFFLRIHLLIVCFSFSLLPQSGEFVAPEKIENIYNQSAFVAQCFVDGDSSQASNRLSNVQTVRRLSKALFLGQVRMWWVLKRQFIKSMTVFFEPAKVSAKAAVTFESTILTQLWTKLKEKNLENFDATKLYWWPNLFPSGQNYVVAVVVPDIDQLNHWCKHLSFWRFNPLKIILSL